MQLQLCKCINFMPWEDLTGPTPVLNLSLKKLHEGKISAHISFLISKLLLKILAGYKLKLLEFRISFLDLKVCIAFPHTNQCHHVLHSGVVMIVEFLDVTSIYWGFRTLIYALFIICKFLLLHILLFLNIISFLLGYYLGLHFMFRNIDIEYGFFTLIF